MRLEAKNVEASTSGLGAFQVNREDLQTLMKEKHGVSWVCGHGKSMSISTL